MDVQLIAKVFDAYRQDASSTDKARYDFFQGLYGLLEGRAGEVGMGGYAVPAEEEVDALYWSGAAVLQEHPVHIDAAAFAETCKLVGDYLAERAGFDTDTASALKACDWADFAQHVDLELAGSDPSRFIDEGAAGAFQLPESLPVSLFCTVLIFAIRAHLQGASEAVLAGFKMPEGTPPHDAPLCCPVCGSPASSSFVGPAAGTDGNGRKQYCSVCGAQWAFERIRCGRCGSQNPTHLHYFHIEGDSAHRLQLCDDCESYSREVYQDDLDVPLCMEAEDVVMAKLDAVAANPRFHKK